MSRNDDIKLNAHPGEMMIAVPERSTLAEFTAQMAERSAMTRELYTQRQAQTSKEEVRYACGVLLTNLDVYQGPGLQDFVTEIRQSKRHVVDQAVIDLVKTTSSIARADVIAQLAHVSLPFGKFWIESPAGDGEGTRVGFLVRANPDKKEFTFKSVHEYDRNIQSLFDDLEQSALLGGGRRALSFFDVPVRVSAYEGIIIDREKHDACSERVFRLLDALSSPQSPQKRDVDFKARLRESGKENTMLAGGFTEAAEYIARILVVLGSEQVVSNFTADKTAADLDHERWNEARIKKKQPLILPATTIKIDLSRINPAYLKPRNAKEARLLLGWTSVRQSKLMVSKLGKVYWRREHERRIPSPVDRRNAVREITSSDPGRSVEIIANRPTQVRCEEPTAGNGSTPQ